MSKPEGIPDKTYRFLGRSGLQVSTIALGGWLTYGGHVDKDLCWGESEIVMGQAIKEFGWKRNDLANQKLAKGHPQIYWGGTFGDNPVNNKGLFRKHIVEGTKFALKRLDLEYVDLIYAHRPGRQTPMEEIVRSFNHVIDQGLAFYWGTSEWTAAEIALAWRVADRLALIGPVMEQPEPG
ncbi:NADP-dependent oxidoreductase domain-containing protein [Dactylonectria macrodidyma]|uniref:NADP-dependent oxidoreductase domain-containing protein n=1 Tax=Dactylonectria macrodidyma TaxID=307937 RepID=A0A9P9EYT1_9HYPO|nr:NADP-dependent oxidoreductase domain-containing protein [Dactylonectria macrodidyma]